MRRCLCVCVWVGSDLGRDVTKIIYWTCFKIFILRLNRFVHFNSAHCRTWNDKLPDHSVRYAVWRMDFIARYSIFWKNRSLNSNSNGKVCLIVWICRRCSDRRTEMPTNIGFCFVFGIQLSRTSFEKVHWKFGNKGRPWKNTRSVFSLSSLIPFTRKFIPNTISFCLIVNFSARRESGTNVKKNVANVAGSFY